MGTHCPATFSSAAEVVAVLATVATASSASASCGWVPWATRPSSVDCKGEGERRDGNGVHVAWESSSPFPTLRMAAAELLAAVWLPGMVPVEAEL